MSPNVKFGFWRLDPNITSLDPRWTLPSKLEGNPLVWMLMVNGLVVDIRTAPLELQEQAFQQGLIPFVPGESG